MIQHFSGNHQHKTLALPLTTLIALLSCNSYGQTDPFLIGDLKQMTLTQLLQLEVITPSRVEQKLIDAPANITVITQSMLRQRGYKNLVEILQDLPGFDFATFEDGGGEYPNHMLNRGIGGNPGSPKLLILLDGIAQNHIGFNWSQLFGEEQLYQDLERIEILQGPASAVYGSNAFSGIIHFITKRKLDSDKSHASQTTSTLWLGEDDTRSLSAFHQSKFNNTHFNAAFKIYKTDGDNGLGRYDPAGYFRDNAWPSISTDDFDNNSQFVTNGDNPFAGSTQPDGFNTSKDDWSIRASLNYFSPNLAKQTSGVEQASMGLFVWNKEEGLGSYTPGFEYQTRSDTYKVHHSAQHYFADLDYRINSNVLSSSRLWYREDRQLPRTGFQYSYRFVNLVKSYHSLNTLWGAEQQFKWQLANNDLLLFGARLTSADKMDQVVSLGAFQDGNEPFTSSSWSGATAVDNPQLGIHEQVDVFSTEEQALYATYDGELNRHLSYSAGLRYDHSEDYSSTVNPRLGLIYKVPNTLFEQWNIKLLYGEAFREPSIFELTDEFRGNNDLAPEEIRTTELVSQFSWQNSQPGMVQSLSLDASFFHSSMHNLITLVQSTGTDSGSRYSNAEQASVRGVSLSFEGQLSHQFSAYINYQFTQGRQQGRWTAVDHTASNKWNLGINWLTWDNRLNVNLRSNISGTRKVPQSNGYYQNDAPGYEKTALTLTINDWTIGSLRLSPQFIVKNLFDEQFAGVGRQDGRSNRAEYDPLTNVNPEGFVPAYHPQPGRTFLFNVKMEF